jgi:hypothetical protein
MLAQSCYDRLMKLVLALTLVLAACGGIQPKRESPIVNEGSDTPESCCCKSNPLTSDDGKPVFNMTNRMECSSQQGECMPDVQCQKASAP